MSRAFADIAFTASVKAAQSRHASRDGNLGYELALDPCNELTELETEFISACDSFYQATVSESGWPYVQHRGGPIGFLRVLDSRTIGYADFRGNRQYLSVGNFGADERVSLFLMDYPNRRRFKLWGRARIVNPDEEPELLATLTVPGNRARVERGIVIRIEAIDWNCPQHITPRYTEAQVRERLASLADEENQENQP